MKLTYMLVPTIYYVLYAHVSNILSHNLLKNDKIDVEFNSSIIEFNRNIRKQKSEIYNIIGQPKNAIEANVFYAHTNFSKLLGGAMSNNRSLFEDTIRTIKTEIVLMTCWSIYAIPYIQYLLENGKRVVIGGSFCNAYDSIFIRSLLADLGTSKRELKNLMIVRGYVGVDTDLHPIISKWEDTNLPETDFADMWTATDDYMKQHILRIMASKGRTDAHGGVMFGNTCWYNRCKFCKGGGKLNFINNVDAGLLYENISTNLNQYQTNALVINDNYLLFTDKLRELFKRLRQDGIKITIITGILKIKTKQYLEDINEYIDEFGVGLESTTDFTLDYINKGYTWKDIQDTMEVLNKYLDKDKRIMWFYIIDLVSRDRQDIIQKYENLLEIKHRLASYGFDKVDFSSNLLQLFPDVELVKNTDHLKMRSETNGSVSGMWYVYNYLRDKFHVEIDVSPQIMIPFERYDINGNLLKSDFEYVDTDTMKQLTTI